MTRISIVLSLIFVLIAAQPLPTFAADFKASLNQAVALFTRGRFDQARSDLARLEVREPKSAPIAYYLGRIALHEGDAADAMQELNRGTKLNERNAEYHYWLGRAYGELAKHAFLFKRPYYAMKTKEEFQQALAHDPGYIYARVALVMYTLKAPGFLGGSHHEAVQNAAIVAKQNAIAGYRAFGLIAEQNGNYVRAQRLYEKAIAEAPERDRPYRWLAGVYRLQKEYGKAFLIYEDRIRQSTPDWVAYYEFAATALESGQRLPQAAQLLRTYLQRGSAPEQPSVADANRLLSRILKK